MLRISMKWFKWSGIPIVVLLIHSFLVVVAWASVKTSDDGETVMGWVLFAKIDWPSSLLLHPGEGNSPFGLPLFVLGRLPAAFRGVDTEMLVHPTQPRARPP